MYLLLNRYGEVGRYSVRHSDRKSTLTKFSFNSDVELRILRRMSMLYIATTMRRIKFTASPSRQACGNISSASNPAPAPPQLSSLKTQESGKTLVAASGVYGVRMYLHMWHSGYVPRVSEKEIGIFERQAAGWDQAIVLTAQC